MLGKNNLNLSSTESSTSNGITTNSRVAAIKLWGLKYCPRDGSLGNIRENK